jgi:TolB-like protein
VTGDLIEELKRRKVFKVGAAYLVVAWLAVQAASIGLPAYDAPPWVLRVFILIALLGFPVAVVMAWVFEATPDGMQLDPVRKGTKRVVAVAVVLVVLAVAWYVKGQPAYRANESASRPKAAPAVSEQSIAVLPFENLSADPDNAFFATGIQDEILTSLAKVGGLKVISRTSTIKYGAKPENLPQIARELGVAHILEGSVQRTRDQVRVNVQLIDARTDQHRWAETYDRSLADIFKVQSEVATAIADALKANLSASERAQLQTAPTRDPQAYEHYLRGRALILNSPTYQREPAERSIVELRAALAIDPNIIEAWTDLAFQEVWLYFSGLDTRPQTLARAREARDRAVALAPDSAEADRARAYVLYYGDLKFAEALQYARRAQATNPNDARMHYICAVLNRRLGRWEDAELDFRRARDLSPNDYANLSELALMLYYQRRFAEALPTMDAAAALQPEDTAILSIKLPTLWNLQGLAGAKAFTDAMGTSNASLLALRARQAQFERDDARALQLYRQSVAMPENGDFWPDDYGGYVPTSVDTRLRLAGLELRLDPPAAEKRYRALIADADKGLAAGGSRYVNASWNTVRGTALAGLGKKAEAVAAGQRAMQLVTVDADKLDGPAFVSYLAHIHAMNGEAAEAVALLRVSTKTVGGLDTPVSLALDPVWDPIRNTPEFKSLLKP